MVLPTPSLYHYVQPVHTTTTVLRPFVRDYLGEPIPEETLTHLPSWSSSNLYQLLPSTTTMASSLFKLRAWQSFCTTSFHVLFGLPLGLEPSTSYSIHFFTQSASSFCSTCPSKSLSEISPEWDFPYKQLHWNFMQRVFPVLCISHNTY